MNAMHFCGTRISEEHIVIFLFFTEICQKNPHWGQVLVSAIYLFLIMLNEKQTNKKSHPPRQNFILTRVTWNPKTEA